MASRRSTGSSVVSASMPRANVERCTGRRAALAASRSAGGRDGALQHRGGRGDLVLAVAAEQLVGTLAGQRDGDVLARQPAEQDEAEAGNVGDRPLEVPDRLVQEAGVLRRAGHQRVMVGTEPLGDHLARRRARETSSSAKPIENVCTGREDCSAISAVIRLESRPPLSITPSGTSLIMRARTDSRSSSSSCSCSSCPGQRLARRAVLPRVPVGAVVDDLAVLEDHQRRRLELAHAGEQRVGAGHEAVGEEELRAERVELRRVPGRRRAAP